MNTHIDQLAEWWEKAEQGTPRIGDTFIAPYPDGAGYEVGIMDSDGLPGNMLHVTRILRRTDTPEPAWHNAIAVIARVDDGSQTPDTNRVALLRDVNEDDQWVRGYCDNVYSDELFDVTPLIEAKVTDEMVQRGAQAATPAGVRYLPPHEVREVLNAALGIEPA